MLHRKFAVVKLWPGLKTAEDECIARLKVTARALGLECIEVDSFARLIHPPHTQLTRDDVDFVINLHFETPKRYDIFSFVALWNPLEFYYEWGYRRCTRHLLTHDDFLTCSSPWADDHVKRCISNNPMRDAPYFSLYHSLSEPILAPTIGDIKLFYAGINWERINKKKGRHSALLNLLEETGNLRIYGPRIFQGVEVWAGHKAYMGPVPFDGVSMIRQIHRAGISLCLSSAAHRQSELMSSRLFESLAAGAVVICDENPFAKRFFGDTLLFIDTRLPPQETAAQVEEHIEWIKADPERAVNLATRAQEIFLQQFTLDRSLENLYRELPQRQEYLASLYRPKPSTGTIEVFCMMPEYTPQNLDQHIANCVVQKDVVIKPTLMVDKHDIEMFGQRIQSRLNKEDLPFTIMPVEFTARFQDGAERSRRRNGELIMEALNKAEGAEYICFVSPSERLFSDHIGPLVAALQNSPKAGAAIADLLCSHKADNQDHADLAEEFSLAINGGRVSGFGRFVFRRSAISPYIHTALPYLDVLPMYLLVGTTGEFVSSGRCTIFVDIQDGFTVRKLTRGMVDKEREILADFAPDVFSPAVAAASVVTALDHLKPKSLSLESMNPEKRTALAVELAHSIPIPEFISKMMFGLYRMWFHRTKAKEDS